jgi:LuxR family transcriptional regulator, regulator of acetate metabolism
MPAGREDSRATRANRKSELTRRALALLDSAALLAPPVDIDDSDDDGGSALASDDADLGILDGELAILAGRLRDRLRYGSGTAGAVLAAVSTTLAEVHAARYEIADFLLHERLRRLAALDAGLAELRRVQDPDELLNRVCEAVVSYCGFDRAMLSQVNDSVWRPWKSFARAEREAERNFRVWISGIPEIELDHLLLESEMVRRHEPAIVTDGPRDPRVYGPLLAASGLISYVAAPLMPTGRVIGLLHADYEDAHVVPLDRDILWAFATGFGQVFERAVLLSRLRDQRVQIRNAMQSVVSVLDELADAEIELASRDHPTALAVSGPSRLPSTTQANQLEGLLTNRELEVLALMATGATNRRIAERLVITDGTVKSHVKRILRKLRAANRSEAISQYLHLTIGRSGE